jgi:hypothetical protein
MVVINGWMGVVGFKLALLVNVPKFLKLSLLYTNLPTCRALYPAALDLNVLLFWSIIPQYAN